MSSNPDNSSGESSPQQHLTDTEQSALPGREQQRLEAKKSYLVDWDGEQDPRDPRTMSAGRKWCIVAVVALGSLLVSVLPHFCFRLVKLTIDSTCTSSIYTAAYEQLMTEFGSSEEVVTLGLALYVLGLAIGPLLFSPLSEV
jgi:hypothetical protein